MMTSNELARVYETLLCIPGMNDQVKLDLKISRKQVLLLTQVIERGLKAVAESPTGIFTVATKEGVADLSKISNDCLEKAGLIELSQKLNTFQ
jgi:hypothetical protein